MSVVVQLNIRLFYQCLTLFFVLVNLSMYYCFSLPLDRKFLSNSLFG